MFRLFKHSKPAVDIRAVPALAAPSSRSTDIRRGLHTAQDTVRASDVVEGNGDADWQHWDDAVSWQNQNLPTVR